MSYELTPNSFYKELSRARTFGFMKDIEYLHANNLALGGSIDNAILLDNYRVINQSGLRYNDEFVRHKVLDSIGDLYMQGHQLLGCFSAYKSGHALNNMLLTKLLNTASAWEYVTIEDCIPNPEEAWDMDVGLITVQ